MTNEEKLKQLLEVAVENGWDCKEYERHLKFKGHIVKVKNANVYYDYQYCNIHKISFNDIITNWEENKVSFIDALVIAHKKIKPHEHIGNPYVNWSWNMKGGKPRPSSQRLDWLFETFKHLLQ